MISNGRSALHELVRAPNETCESHDDEKEIKHLLSVGTLMLENGSLIGNDRLSYGNESFEQTPSLRKSGLLVPTNYVLS